MLMVTGMVASPNTNGCASTLTRMRSDSTCAAADLHPARDDRELLPAVAGEDLVFAEDAHRQRRQLHQHVVARLMAMHVVDALEVIDVEEDQRHGRVVAERELQLAFDALGADSVCCTRA